MGHRPLKLELGSFRLIYLMSFYKRAEPKQTSRALEYWGWLVY